MALLKQDWLKSIDRIRMVEMVGLGVKLGQLRVSPFLVF